MDLVAKRQPILDREGGKLGYEFLLEPDEEGYPENVSENKLPVVKVRTLAEYGIKRAGEGKRVFLTLPIDTLLLKIYELLNQKAVGYKLHRAGVGSGGTVYHHVLDTAESLKKEGAVIVVNSELLFEHGEIIRVADIVEFVADSASTEDIVRVRNTGTKVLVSGIDSQELYQKFSNLADYIQGERVSPAEPIKRIKLAPFLKTTLLRLLVLMNTARTPSEFAKVIETDAGLSAKLLRFINSAYFALRKKINSIEQASVYFGLKNLKNFILVLAMNDYASVENPVVWKKSLIRAKIMEELARNLMPENTSEAYLVGLFSLIDLILEEDVVDFLKEVNVDDLVISAFTDKSSRMASMLNMAILLEEYETEIRNAKRAEDVSILRSIAKDIGVEPEELRELVMRSYIMADTIIHL